MIATVLEALQNSKINFENIGSMAIGLKRHPPFMMAMEQLSNAIKALESGYDANFVLQDAMFGEIKK